LRKKLGTDAEEILTDARLDISRRHFEYAIKRQFDPLDSEQEFQIPLRGAPDMPENGLTYGYLKLTRSSPHELADPQR
jgi:hypothetical protein